jgi:hypothetical protein
MSNQTGKFMDLVNMNAIKRKLERMRCSKCNESPSITIFGNSFKISCCCDDFKRILNQVAESELAAQTKKNIEEQMKRIFK